MTAQKRKINLALQGGGAHGAFAWGVIDRLLESDLFDIESIVGTSAGAMNAAVTAHGLVTGGAEGARAALRTFWQAVSKSGASGPLAPNFFDRLMSPGNLDYNPGFMMLDMLSRTFSPYQLNPFDLNPLRDIVAAQVDFAAIKASQSVKLYICASNVLTGRIKIFDNHDISADAVMASACLPFLYRAVRIGNDYYWDGGYMGNPPIFPVIYGSQSRDIIIVQLNPMRIPEVPTTAQAILDRINTISFNSSLMREMRAINFVTKLIDSGFTDDGRLKKMLIHVIEAEAELSKLGVSSKLNSDWDFLSSLHTLGRERASRFLDQSGDKVGNESSVNIEEMFL